ncbi:MAG: anthranilate phosphoribosyltransferase [Candidatus Omnitrophota bacterium]|nr:anthranilate phosphoribosyltransferase [Candidatus Omnitrophota bacterium]
MIKEAIEKVAESVDLSEGEMRGVFGEIMSGMAESADIKAFLAALRKKGESIAEITAAVKVMREKSVRIDIGGGPAIDTCGTGGSGINTFNISTTAAFVVAGCGVKVAKHGNRSASQQCGSADVLEALGVKIDIAPELTARCIREAGIGFMFAPVFHAAMKYAASPRKELGGKTIFNILGPLSNPAMLSRQVIGVYNAPLTEIIAGVLKNLGSKRAFVAHGMDGMDEITVADRTKISELKSSGRIDTYDVKPEDFGLKKARLEDIKGGSVRDNAEMLLTVLKGTAAPAPRDIVLANASAGLVCAGRSKNFSEGVKLAAESINSGAALDKLSKLIGMTNR